MARRKCSSKSVRPRRASRTAYRIPAVWNCWGYNGKVETVDREIVVDPGDYLAECIAWIRAQGPARPRFARRSPSSIQQVRALAKGCVRDARRTRRGGDWIRRSRLYGTMVRTSTAWDHNGDGRLSTRGPNELGTFSKSILLLPHLARLGVDVLYTLPVVKVSRLFRKGELGCPYSAKNFFEFDPDQGDPLLEKTVGDIAEQFRLLVECAHRLGMRVMLDVAPRTAARDCDWILDYPEWFYWIGRQFERDYMAPRLPGVDYYNPIPGRLDEVYDVPAVREHLRKFRFAPSMTQPQKWANFVTRAKSHPLKNLLAETAQHFGVVTPPGFSDVINDTQPPWSDVTYLRLFEDHPVESAKHLPEPGKQPPYVLYDTAKASLFEGRRPMRALWNKLANIIPFYQSFGIDGARVDMAHALPNELERMILERPRRKDADLCFLAEDLGTDNHARLSKAGYNIIIGPTWWMQPRSSEGAMHELLVKLPKLKVPIMAAAETPDTPRAVTRKGGRKFARQAIVVNDFLPNAVPMINSGLEVLERQPMNLGLDSKPSDRHALKKDDPQYGKLAFFDRFALHWDNAGAKRMIDLIATAGIARSKYLDALTDGRAYFPPKVSGDTSRILATGYRLKRGGGTLLMLANVDLRKTAMGAIGRLARTLPAPEVLVQSGKAVVPRWHRGRLVFNLEPLDAIALVL